MSDAPVSGRPRLLAAFVTAVIVGGGAVVLHSLRHVGQVPNPAAWAVLSVLAVVAATFALKIPGAPAYLSISDAFFIATGLLFGPAPGALTIALDSLLVSMRRKNGWRQLFFNVTASPLSLWCGTQVFYASTGLPPLAGSLAPPSNLMILPLAGMTAVYFLLNSGLTAIAVALSKGLSPWRFWRDHFAVLSVNYFAGASAAFLLLVLVHYVGLGAFALGALAVVMPLIFVTHLAARSWLGRVEDAQRHYRDVNRLYLSTISAFSTAIEAKDGVTSSHIQRVQAYAMGLARALDVTDEPTLQALEAAALLHDTGKLAIPEHILNKPGKLTAHEFEAMKAHVDIGADILSAIDFPFPVVPIVRAHHEHWNGTGYPRGLRGEDIPIGARILSVVDCFDALTSDRPYRPAMSDAAALEIIQQARGTRYDPRVVDTFSRVYREIAPSALPRPKLDALLATIRGAAAPAPPPAPPITAGAPGELLAFVSLARLAAGTPTLADVGALAQGHLRHIAADATIAIFALDESRARLEARYAAGPAADALHGLSMRLGERLTGWVGANLRVMANGDPRLDLLDRTPAGLRAASAVPLVADGTLVGVLALYAATPLSDDQARTVEMIAPHLATAVAVVEAGARAADPARQARSGMRLVAARG